MRESELLAVLKELAEQRPLGVNLTLPLKEAAFRLVQSATPQAVAIGAINCLRWNGAAWEGHNTDGAGWWDSFQQEVGRPITGRPALVLGAGGACRSILNVLRSQTVGSIKLFNRTVEKADALLERGEQALPWDAELFASHLQANSIVVQTTSVGMWPQVDEQPLPWPEHVPQGVIACDLIYNPRPTLWLRKAEERGATILDGCGMLVHQAARAIQWWTGQLPDPKPMREALLHSLADGEELLRNSHDPGSQR